MFLGDDLRTNNNKRWSLERNLEKASFRGTRCLAVPLLVSFSVL